MCALQDTSSELTWQDSSWEEPTLLECREESRALRLPPSLLWTAPISGAEARAALARATELTRAERFSDALLQLRLVEHAAPRVRDRIAMVRAELLLRLSRPRDACDAFAVAESSPERNIATQARIGRARCLLLAADRSGEAVLAELTQRYPNLTGRADLRLLLADARRAWGSLQGAASLYRRIDIEEPQSEAAMRAREALEALRASGTAIPPYTQAEQVERAERLLQRGPVDAARAEMEALQALDALPTALAGRVHLLAARIARLEGRWSDVRSAVAAAMKGGVPAAEALRLLPRGEGGTDDPEQARGDAQARLRKLLGRRSIAKLPNPQLRTALDIAAHGELADEATELLDELRERTSITPAVRFEAAMLVFGLAKDESVAALLATTWHARPYAVSARYHHARALERVGRTGEAEAQYLNVIAADTAVPRYYAMWAELRLWAMASNERQCCVPRTQDQALSRALAPLARPRAEPSTVPGASVLSASLSGATLRGPKLVELLSLPAALPASLKGELGAPELSKTLVTDGQNAPVLPPVLSKDALSSPRQGALAASDVAPALFDPLQQPLAADAQALGETTRASLAQTQAAGDVQVASARREQLLDKLGPLAERHGAAYPWIARARDLIELELYADAADELGAAYLAFRDARGDLRLRAGLEAVLTGNAPARHPADLALRRARLSLDMQARTQLAELADTLGDPGVALRWLDIRREVRPRAYARAVEHAAEKHGVDPNLLFAVMRVESIYHRQIVSYAGAVGLMQIMPRTGLLISQQLGTPNFQVSDLLDPDTNVEFAAWYLRSLLDRFDGRLPLAIAAYNGGPHNVRIWMRRNNPNIPLEAFLERIPFEQTHRYVRRVLTHYAAYRAQQDLPMARLDVTLPEAKADAMAF